MENNLLNQYLKAFEKLGYKKVQPKRKWNSTWLKLTNGQKDLYLYNNGLVRCGKVFQTSQYIMGGAYTYYRQYRLNNKRPLPTKLDQLNYLLKYIKSN